MKTCNCNSTNSKIPILEEGIFPKCPPDNGEIYVYLREFEDTYKLYGYTHKKLEFRLDDLELLTIQIEGVNKITYNGDNEKVFNLTKEDLDVYSKQEVIDLLSNQGIIVIDSLTSDSTTAALSAAKGIQLQQNKVDKEAGKVLTSNDFTNAYKTKLDSIQSGAQPNAQLKTVNNISLYAVGADTNIDIAKGDYTSIIFRQSETQPATPTGTSPVPSGWSTTINSSTGTWWMSSSLINGQTNQATTWSVPIKMVGTNGNSVTYVFKQSDTRPTTPTGTTPIPSGWSDAPTAVGKWWMSKATVSGQTGLVIGSWSVAVQTTAEDGLNGNYTDFKYAVNSSTTVPPTLNNSVRNTPGWSDFPPALTTTTYLWMIQATIVEDSLSGTWSVPVRISGENGKDGQWTSFVFRQSETQPPTPTGTSTIPSGWSDRPSSVGKWWMIKATISGSSNTVIGTWSTPVQVTGEDGVDGNYTDFKYAVNSSLTVAPTINRTVRNPPGWTDVPPSVGDDQYLWLTQAVINPDNTLSDQWSVPVRISGESGKDGEYTIYQYAKNTSTTTSPTTGWVTTPPSLSSGEYLWMRMGVVTPPATSPTSWSVPVRISGENGQQGEAGASLLYMGFWSNSETYTGTPSLRHIVRVDSGATTTYYIAKTTAGTFTGNLPTDTSKWETFEANYKSIATEVLFAAGANIAGWIFRIDDPGTPNERQYLQSQNGRAVLNGTSGDVSFVSGVIGGWEINSSRFISPPTVGSSLNLILDSDDKQIYMKNRYVSSEDKDMVLGELTTKPGRSQGIAFRYSEDTNDPGWFKYRAKLDTEGLSQKYNGGGSSTVDHYQNMYDATGFSIRRYSNSEALLGDFRVSTYSTTPGSPGINNRGDLHFIIKGLPTQASDQLVLNEVYVATDGTLKIKIT